MKKPTPSRIPDRPGVYFFKNKKQDIIYIGKAKSLRKRVASYFRTQEKLDPKTAVMMRNASAIDWIVVGTEVDALLTEANMIKEYKPKYNVFLKDDKTLPYIRITNEPYPRIEIVRMKSIARDGHTYFGPYTDTGYLRDVLKTINYIFPVRSCTYAIDNRFIKTSNVKVCLDYHIKRCDGPCEGLVSSENYQDMVSDIKQFIRGRSREIERYLKDRIDKESKSQRYEEAARYRDQLVAVKEFTKNQNKFVASDSSRDIIGIAFEGLYAIGLVFRIRNGKFITKEKFNISNVSEWSYDIMLPQFILQYYSSTQDIPSEIIIDTKYADILSQERWLEQIAGKKVSIRVPKRGEKLKALNLCKRNAELMLNDIKLKKIKRREYIPKSISQLQHDLSLAVPPRRIEAFDNSNTQGQNPVAAMVTFVNSKPLKKGYRRFNIKTVDGPDDYASMREIIHRRYSRVIKEKLPQPDLILIDGGKGQLSSAKSALDELGLSYIPLIGLAKRLEEVFVPGSQEPQSISKASAGLRLLKNIRDEVHRFAITFHREVRSKDMLRSSLSNISGLGRRRIQSLMSEFESLGDIKSLPAKEVAERTSIPIGIIRELQKELS